MGLDLKFLIKGAVVLEKPGAKFFNRILSTVKVEIEKWNNVYN